MITYLHKSHQKRRQKDVTIAIKLVTLQLCMEAQYQLNKSRKSWPVDRQWHGIKEGYIYNPNATDVSNWVLLQLSAQRRREQHGSNKHIINHQRDMAVKMLSPQGMGCIGK